MNLGKLKFEKVNMKIVLAVGIGIIALLTAAFIIFRTNLIINHKDSDKDKKPNTEETNKPNNPTTPGGESGNNEDDPENPGNEGVSGNSGNGSNNGGNSNQEPDYEDPEEEDEDKISKSVKERTKKAENLTVKEKEYILQDNVTKTVKKNKGMQTNCVKDSFCVLEVKKYTTYSSDEEIGKKITGCSGNIIFYYDSKEKEVVYDMQDVKCK